MKYQLTLTDLTVEELQDAINKLSGDNKAVAVAPSAPVVTPAAPSAPQAAPVAPELDGTGLPWDERIHSSSKKQTAKGVWKKRKGVDEEEIEAVEKELWDKMNPVTAEEPVAPTAPVAPVAVEAPLPPAPSAVPPAPVASVPEAPLPPAPTALPVAAPAAPVAPPVQERNFNGLMQLVADRMSKGTIDSAYVDSLIQRVNTGYGVTITSLTDIAHDTAKVDYVFACIDLDDQQAAA